MTEREKLIETIRAFHVEKRSYSTHAKPSDDEALADALMAAGFGDVSEFKRAFDALQEQALRAVGHYETAIKIEGNLREENKELRHRAEVAERALKRVCHIYYMGRRYTTNSSLEPNEWSMYDDLIRLAERELEEAKP